MQLDAIDMLLIMTGLLAIVYPVLILSKGYSNSVSRVFALMAVISGTLWCFSVLFFRKSTNISDALLWDRVIYLAGTIVPPLFYYFTTIFPLKTTFIFVEKVFVLVPTLVFLYLIFFTSFFITGTEINDMGNRAFLGDIYVLWALWFIFVMALSLIKILTNYSKLSGMQKNQARFILFSSLFPVIGSLPFNVILPAFGEYDHIWIGPLSMILMFGIITYAMVKNRLFGIRFIFGNFIYYAVRGSILIGILYICLEIMSLVWGDIYSTGAVVSFLVLGTAYMLSADYLHDKIKAFFEKFFIFSAFDPYLVMNRITKLTATELSITRIVMNIFAIIKTTFGIEKVGLILFSESGDVLFEKSTGYDLASQNTVSGLKKTMEYWMYLQTKNTDPKILVRDEISFGLSKMKDEKEVFMLTTILNFMNQEEIAILLPLEKKVHLNGIMLLEDKAESESYSAEEINLISSIASTTSVSISRALLYEQVQQFAQTLQKRVTEATAEITKQRDEISETLRKERDMLDVLAHELRTPLSIAKNSVKIFKTILKPKQPTDTVSVAEVMEKLVITEDHLEKESEILETILSSTKIESKQMKIEFGDVNCKDVVSEVVSKYKGQAEKKGLVIQMEIPEGDVRCYTGRNQLVEVIGQLISNAIKYTDKGSITIKLEDMGDEIKFSVIDTGIGMSKDDIPNLGKKFYRVNMYTSKAESDYKSVRPGGTGIGLFIVFSMVELMKGKVVVESEVGKGSTFSVILPKEEPVA